MSDGEGWVETTIVTQDPLLLRVGPDPGSVPARGVSIGGTVVDPQGKPVAGSNVIVIIETGRQPAGQPGGELVREKRSTLVTDEHGRFLMTLADEKGTRFRAIAVPDGYNLAGSEWIEAAGTDPVTFKPIRVTPLRTITGRVTDTEGRPVAAAMVLNWGNPAPLTSALTGPDGAFRLEGLPPAEFRLSVDAPGYRFHGEVREAGNSPVEIRIRRDDQPPARSSGRGGRSSTGRMPSSWPARSSRRTAIGSSIPRVRSSADARSRVLEVLAKIDPEAAWRKCQAGESPWNHNAVRIAVAHDLIHKDVDKAQAIIASITSEFWRNWTRFELIDAVPADRRELRSALLDQALSDARAANDPGAKATLLMRVAQRLLDQGQREEARRLVDEALPLARTADARDERLGPPEPGSARWPGST